MRYLPEKREKSSSVYIHITNTETPEIRYGVLLKRILHYFQTKKSTNTLQKKLKLLRTTCLYQH